MEDIEEGQATTKRASSCNAILDAPSPKSTASSPTALTGDHAIVDAPSRQSTASSSKALTDEAGKHGSTEAKEAIKMKDINVDDLIDGDQMDVDVDSGIENQGKEHHDSNGDGTR